MADTRGVFGLSRAYQRIAKGSWVDPQTVFSANFATTPNAGYFAGGTTPAEVSSIDKCNFTDDTTALLPSADLTGVRSTHGSVSSNKAGYYLGGRTPLISSCDKLNYSIETISKTPSLNLTSVIQDARGFGNDTHGYSTGGYNGSSYVSVVDKIIFGTDTSFRFPSANLITQRNIHGALATQDAGYVTNGYDGSGYVNSAEKTVFATDTTTAIPSTFPGSRGGVTGASTDTIGYISGGVEPGPIFYSTVNKFTFSTETPGAAPTLPSANSLPASLQYNGGAATSSLAYFAGGKGSGAAINTMCTINAANDTKTNVPGANLTATRYNYSAVTPKGQSRTIPSYLNDFSRQNTKGTFGSIHGYVANAYSYPTGNTSIVSRVEYENDVVARVPSADFALSSPASTGKVPFSSGPFGFGYFVGGIGPLSDIIKLNYATETSANVPAKIAQPQSVGAGAASDKAGYMLGGSKTGAYTNNCIKIDLATDSSELLTNNLSVSAGFKAAVSTPAEAYATGGVSPGPTQYTRTDKFTFVTDTSVAVPGASLVTAKSQFGSNGDTKAGYYTGGAYNTTNYSNTEKLTFATESIQVVPINRSIGAMSLADGTGNQSQGYMFGGNIAPSTTNYSSVDKLNYASGTMFRIGSDLVLPQYYTAATSALEQNQTVNQPYFRSIPRATTLTSSIPGSVSNNGYITGGGSVPGALRSDVDKLIFATDTVQYLPSTTLSSARYRHTGSASSTAGYFGGGTAAPGTPGRRSTMDKLTFSTDSCVAVPGAALSEATYGAATASSTTFGYFAGGAPGGPYRSATDKLTFSSDTTATVPSAQLNQGLFFGDGGSASSSAAYLGGSIDIPGTPLSSVARITFSNDTRNQVPSAALIASKYSQTAGHNTTHAYFTGGAPSIVSTVSKITFATETTQQSTNYPITIYAHSACGNATAGYFSNGSNPSPNYISSIYKLNYTTETFGLMGVSFLSLGNAVSASLSAREGGAAYTSNVL